MHGAMSIVWNYITAVTRSKYEIQDFPYRTLIFMLITNLFEVVINIYQPNYEIYR